MAIDTKKYDDIFVEVSNLHRTYPRVLKAIVKVESSFLPRAYRFEPAFYKRLCEKEPFWIGKDPSVVSASYGLAQIMFTTAWSMGMKPTNWKSMKSHEFQALAEGLYDPETNITYESRLIRALLDSVWKTGIPNTFEHLSAMDVALARYNGGSGGNPRDDGTLRNQSYVDKVWRAFDEVT